MKATAFQDVLLLLSRAQCLAAKTCSICNVSLLSPIAASLMFSHVSQAVVASVAAGPGPARPH